MNLAILGVPAVILVSLTSLILLLNRNWRLNIIALAIQYVGVFFLVVVRWPLEMAITKVVAGWMASAVLGMALSELLSSSTGNWQEGERFWPAGRVFRLLAALMVGLTVLSLAPRAIDWIPGLGAPQAWGSLILIGMGLLQLGLTAQPLRVIIGLLTILSGFEILYATVETSALVEGLLAVVNLGLALVGAYLVLSPAIEETP